MQAIGNISVLLQPQKEFVNLKLVKFRSFLLQLRLKQSYNNDKFQRKMRRMRSKNLIDFFREDSIII